MLTDIFWHSYFNIYGELFVDDPDKGKTSVTLFRKYFGIYILSTMKVFFIKVIKYV